MKFSYKFNNLLGTVFRKGDLLFTPDGNSVISPVGNRISIFDLKNNKSTTLPIESRFNFNALDISPNGCTLLAVNEEGDAHLISLISQTSVHKYRFKRKVRAVKFSPDGKHFAVCKDSNVFVFKAPGPFSGEYNAFVMERVYHGAFDETTCLDWSFDSRILAVGSKDMSVKLYPLEKWENFKIYTLGNHTEGIVGCYFEENSYDMISISRNGQLCIWECTVEPKDLVPLGQGAPKVKKTKKEVSDSEDEIDEQRIVEQSENELTESLKKIEIKNEVNKFFYKRLARHYLADEAQKDKKDALLSSVAYHKQTKILVTGFTTGAFFIHELPDVNLIHSLNISEQKISSIALNNTGDWIALGCSGLGQLLVWEWQSETYVMKQQGHSNNMSCVSYSKDGQFLATGGEDGKVKLWNVLSGFCFVTFSEHTNAISAVAFSGNKKFVVSSSLDGTVRAYDIIRYRNFRTFTSLRPVQFSCVAVDSSGEFVAAAGQDVFEAYLWSVKTGKLLEVLSGHEGPIASLAFSPSITSTTLATVSWDKTLRIWEAIERGAVHETIELISDGLCVAFRPDGQEVAVATLDGQITFFDFKNAIQTSNIEGKKDLGSGRADSDLITAKKTQEAKAFTSLCYSADGECLLAGGQSKNVCIYHVQEGILIKKFEITQNRSLDAVDDFINRRKMTEFGNVALVEEREELEGGNKTIKLPGVRKGDMASRVLKPEIRVTSLEFSPTGQQWVAATTEGLLIYSLNSGLIFDPWELQIGITPASIRVAIEKEDYVNALMMSMKLNETNLIQEVIENVPLRDVDLIIRSLNEKYAKRLLQIISSALDNSRHLEYYLNWATSILTIFGPKINGRQNMPALLALEKSLVNKYQQISKMCDYNTYTMQFVGQLGDVASRKLEPMDVEKSEESSDENFDSDE